jgi:hypothetical protein
VIKDALSVWTHPLSILGYEATSYLEVVGSTRGSAKSESMSYQATEGSTLQNYHVKSQSFFPTLIFMFKSLAIMFLKLLRPL